MVEALTLLAEQLRCGYTALSMPFQGIEAQGGHDEACISFQKPEITPDTTISIKQ
jgi:hypothetical protein